MRKIKLALILFFLFPYVALANACPSEIKTINEIRSSEFLAINGDLLCAYKLAMFFEIKENYKEADKWFNKATLSGNSVWLYNYAISLQSRNISEYTQRAISIYEKLSQENDYKSQRNLGDFYNSIGESKKAVGFYRKAAMQGDALSMRGLVSILGRSKDRDDDIIEAYLWAFIYSTKVAPISDNYEENQNDLQAIKDKIPKSKLAGIERKAFDLLWSVKCEDRKRFCLLEQE